MTTLAYILWSLYAAVVFCACSFCAWFGDMVIAGIIGLVLGVVAAAIHYNLV